MDNGLGISAGERSAAVKPGIADRSVVYHLGVERAAGDRAVVAHLAIERTAGDRARIVIYNLAKRTAGNRTVVLHTAGCSGEITAADLTARSYSNKFVGRTRQRQLAAILNIDIIIASVRQAGDPAGDIQHAVFNPPAAAGGCRQRRHAGIEHAKQRLNPVNAGDDRLLLLAQGEVCFIRLLRLGIGGKVFVGFHQGRFLRCGQGVDQRLHIQNLDVDLLGLLHGRIAAQRAQAIRRDLVLSRAALTPDVHQEAVTQAAPALIERLDLVRQRIAIALIAGLAGGMQHIAVAAVRMIAGFRVIAHIQQDRRTLRIIDVAVGIRETAAAGDTHAEHHNIAPTLFKGVRRILPADRHRRDIRQIIMLRLQAVLAVILRALGIGLRRIRVIDVHAHPREGLALRGADRAGEGDLLLHAHAHALRAGVNLIIAVALPAVGDGADVRPAHAVHQDLRPVERRIGGRSTRGGGRRQIAAEHRQQQHHRHSAPALHAALFQHFRHCSLHHEYISPFAPGAPHLRTIATPASALVNHICSTAAPPAAVTESLY